jgi:hypothetical protein
MKRLSVIALALFALSAQTGTGWVTLFDGKDLSNFNQVGTANWQIVDGAATANMGTGFLVSKENYTDFEIKVEFFAGPGGNSGVYMRCLDGSKITDKTCYEANVYDKRPELREADCDRGRGRQVEHLRDHNARRPHRREAEWDDDGGYEGQHAEERPDRAAVSDGRHQDPERADTAALRVALGDG